MGKESKQAIVLLVIVLAAVVLIDIGNSRLSGKLVDRRNVVDKIIDLDAQTVTNDADTTSALDSPSLRGVITSSGGSSSPEASLGNTNWPAVGDLDNDRDLDVYLTFFSFPGGKNTNLLLYNDGKGQFTSVKTAITDGMLEAASGDLDGDGDIDVVAAGYTNDHPLFGYKCGVQDQILYNDGRGGLSSFNPNQACPQPVFPSPPVPCPPTMPADTEITTRVKLGDLDSDGDLDAFLANQLPNVPGACAGATGQDRIYINDGRGVFTDATFGQPPRLPIARDQTDGATLGDVDGDRDLDLITINSLPSVQTDVLLNDGKGYFTAFTGAIPPLVNSYSPFWPLLADLDNDQDRDMILTTSSSSILILANDGKGRFTVASFIPARSLTADVADVDSDGDLDIVTENYSCLPTATTVLINTGNLQFQPVAFSTYYHPAPQGACGIIVTAGDFNQDGKPDILFTRTSSDSWSYDLALHK